MDFFDLADRPTDRVYALLAGLVTPRPIAWVTSLDEQGRANAAPFSFFNLLGVNPPIVALGIGDREDGTPKDTARNLLTTREFTIHLVPEPLAAAMVETARELPPGVDELAAAGLATTPGTRVRSPRITAASAALECRLERELRLGENRIFLGEVLAVHTATGLVDPVNWRVDTRSHAPIGRLHSPDGYCRTTDRFAIEWPE